MIRIPRRAGACSLDVCARAVVRPSCAADEDLCHSCPNRAATCEGEIAICAIFMPFAADLCAIASFIVTMLRDWRAPILRLSGSTTAPCYRLVARMD